MKTVETKTSTGGLMIEYFNADGSRQRLVHRAGKAYSGKMAQMEARERLQERKNRK